MLSLRDAIWNALFKRPQITHANTFLYKEEILRILSADTDKKRSLLLCAINVNQSHYTTSHHNVRKCYKSIMLPGLLSTEIEVAQEEKYIHRSPKVIYTNMMQWELELLLNMPVVTGKLVNKASRPFSVTICIHIDGSTQHLFQGVNKTFDKMILSMQELLWKHCMLKTEVNISHKF